ncbi:hypothetical protein N9N67_02330, partial [Bacteriovoracaceae bacterium]|nr:hypothetical protein [Bacteriovoracaceae bacterium]
VDGVGVNPEKEEVPEEKEEVTPTVVEEDEDNLNEETIVTLSAGQFQTIQKIKRTCIAHSTQKYKKKGKKKDRLKLINALTKACAEANSKYGPYFSKSEGDELSDTDQATLNTLATDAGNIEKLATPLRKIRKKNGRTKFKKKRSRYNSGADPQSGKVKKDKNEKDKSGK